MVLSFCGSDLPDGFDPLLLFSDPALLDISRRFLLRDQPPSLLHSATGANGHVEIPRTVHVTQGEFATVDSSHVQFIGTDEMTTCIGVALRNPVTSRTALAHLDSPACVAQGLLAMEESMGSTASHGSTASLEESLGSPAEQGPCAAGPVLQPLEVTIVGGYNDTALRGRNHASSLEEVSTMPRPERHPPPVHRAASEHVETTSGSDIRTVDGRSPQPAESPLSSLLEPGNAGIDDVGNERSTDIRIVGVRSPQPAESSRQESGDAGVDDGGNERSTEPQSESFLLLREVLMHLSRSPTHFLLRTCCLWNSNTTFSSGSEHPQPRTRAFWVDTRTGEAHTAAVFSDRHREPDPVLRYAVVCALRAANGGGIVSLYKASEDKFVLPRVRLGSRMPASYWRRALELSDDQLLQYFSTSPHAESANFVFSMRKLFSLYAKPDYDDIFHNRQPLEYLRSSEGLFIRTDASHEFARIDR